MRKLRFIFTLGLIVLLASSIVIPPSVHAANMVTVGGSVVAKYKGFSTNCPLKDLYTNIYADKFFTEITYDPLFGDPIAQKKFYFLNEDAWENDLKNNQTYDNVDDVDFMFFTGHGYRASYGYTTYNSAHYPNTNSSTPHGYKNEGADASKFLSTEATWGTSNGSATSTKWVTMHTCNFLNNITDKTLQWGKFSYNIMGGIHMICGFATQMYVDSDEGWYYGKKLREGGKIKWTFYDGAAQYQPQNSQDVAARVLCAKISNDDTLTSYSVRPLPYSQAPANSYFYQDYYIDGTDSGTDWTWPKL